MTDNTAQKKKGTHLPVKTLFPTGGEHVNNRCPFEQVPSDTSNVLEVQGPPGDPISGNYFEYHARPLEFLQMCAGYGDVVRLRMGPLQVYFVNHPDLIKLVLVSYARKFGKGFNLASQWPIHRLLGNGVFLSDGDIWHRQRKSIQPPFQPKRLADYGAMIVECTLQHVSTWRDGQTLEVEQDMGKLVLSIVSRIFFSLNPADAKLVGGALGPVLRAYYHLWQSLYQLPSWVPTPGNLQFRRAIRRLDEVVWDLIERRRGAVDSGDLMALLLVDQGNKHGSFMHDPELRDQVVTLLVASYETSALALTWSLFLLGNHPQAGARMISEVDKLAGHPPTEADLSKLDFTNSVVLESLRLYPPVWRYVREAIDNVDLEGARIPKGALVLMSPWLVHHDQRFFDGPEDFRPERWEAGFAKTIPQFAYFPFGGGPRVCPAEKFVQKEATLALATIIQRFRLEPVPAPQIVPEPTFLLRPKDGLKMVVHER